MKPNCLDEINQIPKRLIFFRFSWQQGSGDTWHGDTWHDEGQVSWIEISEWVTHGMMKTMRQAIERKEIRKIFLVFGTKRG